MDNSNKPSPSNVQDAGKKEGLAKKMKAAKAPVKMQKSPKKVGLPKNLVNFKGIVHNFFIFGQISYFE